MNLAIHLLDTRNFALPPGQKVITAQEYSVIAQASALIDQAHLRAEEIDRKAKEAYQSEKERGYQDGQIQSRMEQSEQMLKMVDRSISYLADIESSLADLLINAVGKIIDGYDDRQLTVGLIRSGLQHVRNERQVNVRVAPAHYNHVKEQITAILAGYKGISVLNPVSDPRLAAGQCILESRIGVVDASIDLQLKALKKRFSELTSRGSQDIASKKPLDTARMVSAPKEEVTPEGGGDTAQRGAAPEGESPSGGQPPAEPGAHWFT